MPKKAKKKPAANSSTPKVAAAKKTTEPKAAKPKTTSNSNANTKPKAKGKGTRYTPEQKKAVLSYVNEVNAKKGRGGAAAASRKFNISQITIGQWVKKAGAPAKPKKSATKKSAAKKGAVKGRAKSAGKGFADKLRRLADVHEEIGKAEAQLDSLKKEYATLKKSL